MVHRRLDEPSCSEKVETMGWGLFLLGIIAGLVAWPILSGIVVADWAETRDYTTVTAGPLTDLHLGSNGFCHKANAKADILVNGSSTGITAHIRYPPVNYLIVCRSGNRANNFFSSASGAESFRLMVKDPLVDGTDAILAPLESYGGWIFSLILSILVWICILVAGCLEYRSSQ